MKNELLDNLVLHDEMAFHVAAGLENRYIENIGRTVFEINKQKLANKKLSYLISLVTSALREKKMVTIEDLLQQVEREFRSYEEVVYRQDTVLNEIPEVTLEEKAELALLYKEVMAKVHPLLYRRAAENRNKFRRWAEDYYRRYDLAGMRYLSYAIEGWQEDEYPDNAEESVQWRDDLVRENALIKRRINTLKNNYPFDKADLLSDEAALQKTRRQLNLQLSQLKDEFEYYRETLMKLARG